MAQLPQGDGRGQGRGDHLPGFPRGASGRDLSCVLSLRFGVLLVVCSAGQLTAQLFSDSPRGSEARRGPCAQGLPGLTSGVAGAEVSSRLGEIIGGIRSCNSALSVAGGWGLHVAPWAGHNLAVGPSLRPAGQRVSVLFPLKGSPD